MKGNRMEKRKHTKGGTEWKYAVWVGGVEDLYMDYKTAKEHHDEWLAKGYDDVQLEVLND
jgi:hypothetical protein